MNNEIAVIMAAGLGSRMRPLTYKIPKPLVNVHGTPMIEGVISLLRKRNVSKIYVVVGYLKEQFEYLEKKYDNLFLINNDYFDKVNNISSIFVVKDLIKTSNCFICEADLFIPDSFILENSTEQSCYFGKYIKGYSDDWGFIQDVSGNIVKIRKGVDDCFNMCGISYFTKSDSAVLAEEIEKVWLTDGYKDLFWDEVVNKILDKISLKIYPVSASKIIEIDSVEELNCIEHCNCIEGGKNES